MLGLTKILNFVITDHLVLDVVKCRDDFVVNDVGHHFGVPGPLRKISDRAVGFFVHVITVVANLALVFHRAPCVTRATDRRQAAHHSQRNAYLL